MMQTFFCYILHPAQWTLNEATQAQMYYITTSCVEIFDNIAEINLMGYNVNVTSMQTQNIDEMRIDLLFYRCYLNVYLSLDFQINIDCKKINCK